jgi:sporulation protein YlmC with PRC-barrel domain
MSELGTLDKTRKDPSDAGGPGPRLMTASTLQGNPVINSEGETLGKIVEIMLDVPRGRIAYAVMSSGGFLRIGDKLFALPFSALTLDTDRKCFIIDAPREKVESAPGFDKDRWPDSADMTWQREVHRHFGRTPYWDEPRL